MSKPLNQYVRVPFRGTHYVEAAALDAAIAQIAALEKQAGIHHDEQGGSLEVPEESALQTESDAAHEVALEELCQMCGGEVTTIGPSEILAFVKNLQSDLKTAETERSDHVAKGNDAASSAQSFKEALDKANADILRLDGLWSDTTKEVLALRAQLKAAGIRPEGDIGNEADPTPPESQREVPTSTVPAVDGDPSTDQAQEAGQA